MVDREGIQAVCSRFSVFDNSDEQAFERVIDLSYRGEGGLKTLPKTFPSQLPVNARGIHRKKRMTILLQLVPCLRNHQGKREISGGLKARRRNMVKLTSSGKALVVTMLLQMLFGGYLIALDHYAYDDTESALTVLVIYSLLGVFTAMFLFGKRLGLAGILWLSTILIVFQTAFIIITSLGQVDAGLHYPSANLWVILIRYPLFLLTLIFSVRIYREKREFLKSQQ
jgi:hypothetical protein